MNAVFPYLEKRKYGLFLYEIFKVKRDIPQHKYAFNKAHETE